MFDAQTKCKPGRRCRRTISQFAGIRVPVTVTPQVLQGPVSTICCGPPILDPAPSPCGNNQNQSCSFTIIQNLRILIPIEFGANVDTDTPFVRCMAPSAEPIEVSDNEVDGFEETSLTSEDEAVFTTEQAISPDFENCIVGTRALKEKGI